MMEHGLLSTLRGMCGFPAVWVMGVITCVVFRRDGHIRTLEKNNQEHFAAHGMN